MAIRRSAEKGLRYWCFTQQALHTTRQHLCGPSPSTVRGDIEHPRRGPHSSRTPPKTCSWHGPWLACMHSLLHTVQHHRQTTQHLSSLGSTHAHSHARALFPSSQFPDKYGLSSDWQDHGRIESRNTPLPKTISWRQSHSFLLTPSCTTDIQTYINTYIHTYRAWTAWLVVTSGDEHKRRLNLPNRRLLSLDRGETCAQLESSRGD